MSEEQASGAGQEFEPGKEQLERDLVDLQELVPNVGEFLPELFREAVSDSLTNTFGDETARALVIMMGETSLMRPQEAFPQLDSIVHDGAEILKGAIRAEFGAAVHSLLAKARAGQFSDARNSLLVAVPETSWSP